MSVEYVQVCTSFSGSTCVTAEWMQATVLPPEAEPNMNLFLSGGFDSEVALLAFTGGLLLMATGFGVGVILSQVRKMRMS